MFRTRLRLLTFSLIIAFMAGLSFQAVTAAPSKATPPSASVDSPESTDTFKQLTLFRMCWSARAPIMSMRSLTRS